MRKEGKGTDHGRQSRRRDGRVNGSNSGGGGGGGEIEMNV